MTGPSPCVGSSAAVFFLFLILALVTLVIHWIALASILTLTPSSSGQSHPCPPSHAVSAARPWNVCRACSVLQSCSVQAQGAQPWPEADPGPKLISQCTETMRSIWPLSHWFLNGRHIPPHVGQFICLLSVSFTLNQNSAPYHQGRTLVGWHDPMLKVKLC